MSLPIALQSLIAISTSLKPALQSLTLTPLLTDAAYAPVTKAILKKFPQTADISKYPQFALDSRKIARELDPSWEILKNVVDYTGTT